jgi:small conductance mechanosensitive channel
VQFAPKVAGAILVWFVGVWVIGKVSKLFVKAMELQHLDISVRSFLQSLVSIGLRILLLFSIAGIVGIETSSFVAVLGAASLAVGLALQGSLSNFAGGVLILIFRPFRVGDIISAGGHNGLVQEIQIFCTILLTSENKTVILPNGGLANGTIVNFSTKGELVFEILLELSYKNDFDKLKAILLEVCKTENRITNPSVGIAKLGTSTWIITVKGSTKPDEQSAVVGDLTEKIKYAFVKNGVIAT